MKRFKRYSMEHCTKIKRLIEFRKLNTAHLERMIAKTKEEMKKNPPPVIIAAPFWTA